MMATCCWLRNVGASTARIVAITFTPDGEKPRDCGTVKEVPARMSIYALNIPLTGNKANQSGTVSVRYRGPGWRCYNLKARPEEIRSNQWEPR